MDPKNKQVTKKPSANEAAAGLALATHLSQGMMPQNPMPDQTQPGQPTQPTTPTDNPEPDAKFKELEGKMDTMKAEMESMIKGEVSSVKDIIIEALNKDDQ